MLGCAGAVSSTEGKCGDFSTLVQAEKTSTWGHVCARVCVGVCVPTELCRQEGRAARSQQDGPAPALLLALCCQAVDPPDEWAVEGVTPTR